MRCQCRSETWDTPEHVSDTPTPLRCVPTSTLPLESAQRGLGDAAPTPPGSSRAPGEPLEQHGADLLAQQAPTGKG